MFDFVVEKSILYIRPFSITLWIKNALLENVSYW
jgi:hypothetical protein